MWQLPYSIKYLDAYIFCVHAHGNSLQHNCSLSRTESFCLQRGTRLPDTRVMGLHEMIDALIVPRVLEIVEDHAFFTSQPSRQV